MAKNTALRLVVITSIALTLCGCPPATSEQAFVGDRDEVPCEGVFQQCKGKTARCRLDDNKYITGEFPGGKEVLVETPPGDWVIKVMLFLDPKIQPRSPGTDLDITWYEPGCSDLYRYQLTRDRVGGDLFEKAGPDNVFEVGQAVIEPGDHLVEISTDARSRYALRLEIARVE